MDVLALFGLPIKTTRRVQRKAWLVDLKCTTITHKPYIY